VYRGINQDNKDHNKFWSSSRSFAEDYGDIIEARLKLEKVFDTADEQQIKELYNNGIRLHDPYNDREYLTAEDYINSYLFGVDSWEAFEETPGALSYILKHYDIIILYEGGVKNYYVNNSDLLT
jgi:hypothetical protein